MDNIIIRDERVQKALKQAKEITDYDYSDCSVGALVTAIEDLVLAYKDLDIKFDDYKGEHPERDRAYEIGVAGKRGY